jgi:hydrogenase-4 component B
MTLLLLAIAILAASGLAAMVAGNHPRLATLPGVSLALYQRDRKRALAYSSIENVGLILLALGVGMLVLAFGWVVLRGRLIP